MSNHSNSLGLESLSYIALPTFTDWWFLWELNVQIDFQEIRN